MVMLISREGPDGTQSICDAKCYNAMGAACVCPCSGANHGIGREMAIQSTRELAARTAAAGPEVASDRGVYVFYEAGLDPGADAGLESELEAEAG